MTEYADLSSGMWIFENFRRDACFFILPGFVGLIFGWMIPESSTVQWLYLFLALAVVDSGHVYTTALRTYLNPEERKSSAIYWVLPLVISALFFLWSFFSVPHLWAFVIYATVFHHVRQFYGISRWYQKLGGRFCRASSFFLYALTLSPFALYHFRPGARAEYYSANDLFLLPNQFVYEWLFFLYGALVAAWLGFEIMQSWKKVEVGRILSIGIPGILYGATLLIGTTSAQILVPLILAHGMGYFGLMILSLQRTQAKRYPVLWKAAAMVAMIAVLFGAAESGVEESLIDFESNNAAANPAQFFQSLLVGIYLTPLFSHFVLDAIIWRRSHREASLLFAIPKSPTEQQNTLDAA